MRVSAISTYQIPVLNFDRAVRFYREVFDLPVTFTAHEESHLSFNGEPITFDRHTTSDFRPITLEIVVQNTPNELNNHFINYEVPISDPIETENKTTIFPITDFEGNQIRVITHK